jgi:hypothetical protein
MKWLIGFLGGVFGGLIEWLVKKIGIAKLLIAFKITIATVFIGFLLSAVTYLTLFLMEMWNLFKDVISFYSTIPSVGGSSFGVNNQSLVTSFFGLLNESGLSTAFETAGNLAISLISMYFVIQAYRIYMYAINHIRDIIDTLLALMTR